MLRVRAALLVLAALSIIPVAAHAQTLASITGVARVVVTDSNGQLDLRLGKLLRFNATRTLLSMDIYNAILIPRFIRFSAQFDF